MQTLDTDATVAILNKIMQYELAGVVRYTHSALMVRGPFRAPICLLYTSPSPRD